MAVEQMKNEEELAFSNVSELSDQDAGKISLDNSERLFGSGGELDPKTIDVSSSTEIFDETNMKISFKENATTQEKDKAIITLLARKNESLGNPLGGKTTNILTDNGKYYLDSSKGKIGIQNRGGLSFLKKFDFSVQSSLIGGVDKKNDKRTIAISRDSLNLVK